MGVFFFRNLYRQLAEIRDAGTDSCSSLSYGEEIEMEKELVEAKKEVVDDHNLRLNKQLSRVHDMLKVRNFFLSPLVHIN